MTVQVLPFRAKESLWHKLFGLGPARSVDPKEIKRRARIELAHLPPHLKQDIGLLDD